MSKCKQDKCEGYIKYLILNRVFAKYFDQHNISTIYSIKQNLHILIFYQNNVKTMLTEQELVCQLLEDDYYQQTEPYDPYRTRNPLKDCSKFLNSTQNHMLRSARPKKKPQDLQNEFANCKSLKKVLEKLETQQSPQKKQQKHIAVKENLDPPVISSARETASISHYSGFNMSTVFKKFQSLKKQKIVNLPSRLLTQHSHQLKRSQSKNQEKQFEKEEQIIRSLIKKKMSERHDFKIRNTSNKATIQYKQNEEPPELGRKNTSSSKMRSKKIMLFIS